MIFKIKSGLFVSKIFEKFKKTFMNIYFDIKLSFSYQSNLQIWFQIAS